MSSSHRGSHQSRETSKLVQSLGVRNLLKLKNVNDLAELFKLSPDTIRRLEKREHLRALENQDEIEIISDEFVELDKVSIDSWLNSNAREFIKYNKI